jgi:hypothetical protein
MYWYVKYCGFNYYMFLSWAAILLSCSWKCLTYILTHTRDKSCYSRQTSVFRIQWTEKGVLNNRSTPEMLLGYSNQYNNFNAENGKKKDKFLVHREWVNTHTTLRINNRLISNTLLMFPNNDYLENKDNLYSLKTFYAFILT